MPKNYFLGKPCDCGECRPALHVKCLDNDGCRILRKLQTDRKGISYYDFKTYS